MIELIPDVPENVLAVTAKGEVTEEDYDAVITPALEEKLKDHDKIRFLYHLSPEFTGFKGGAAWDDTKIGVKYFNAFEKIAMVADKKWVRRSVKTFGFLFPGEVKTFKGKELDEALAWVAD